MTILVIGGAPGSGKTALARHLAAMQPQGVHIETDYFFRFLSHRLDPSRPEAGAQNAVVLRACAAAARTYSDAGYAVFLDGVIGPWSLPLLMPLLPAFDYVVLQAPLATLLARAAARTGQPSATPEVVTRMHALFESAQQAVGRHGLPSNVDSTAAMAQTVRMGAEAGVWRVARD